MANLKFVATLAEFAISFQICCCFNKVVLYFIHYKCSSLKQSVKKLSLVWTVITYSFCLNMFSLSGTCYKLNRYEVVWNSSNLQCLSWNRYCLSLSRYSSSVQYLYMYFGLPIAILSRELLKQKINRQQVTSNLQNWGVTKWLN